MLAQFILTENEIFRMMFYEQNVKLVAVLLCYNFSSCPIIYLNIGLC